MRRKEGRKEGRNSDGSTVAIGNTGPWQKPFDVVRPSGSRAAMPEMGVDWEHGKDKRET